LETVKGQQRREAEENGLEHIVLSSRERPPGHPLSFPVIFSLDRCHRPSSLPTQSPVFLTLQLLNELYPRPIRNLPFSFSKHFMDKC
jgi:hypothetical protein